MQLWQSLIDMGIHVGQNVRIKDASLAYNGHYKDMTFALLQQEQMKALHSTIAKMDKNISSLSGKVHKVKGQVSEFPSNTDTDSDDRSGTDELRVSIDAPVASVPEFRSTSKRHKFSLKRYMPRNMTKLVAFAGLVSALLALILACWSI